MLKKVEIVVANPWRLVSTAVQSALHNLLHGLFIGLPRINKCFYACLFAEIGQ